MGLPSTGMYGPTLKLEITDDRVLLEGADVTGKLTRLALEVDWENRLAWASFQAAVAIEELGLSFPIETVKGYLGGASGLIDLPRSDLVERFEAAAARAGGYGSGETAVGEAIVEVLKELGVSVGDSAKDEDKSGDEWAGYGS